MMRRVLFLAAGLAVAAATTMLGAGRLGGGAAPGTPVAVERAFVGAWRVTFWGALAMGITAGVGALFGVAA